MYKNVIFPAKKNARAHMTQKVFEIAEKIKNINMQIMIRQKKFQEMQNTDWYHKAMLDKDMADIVVDQMVLEE